MQITKISQLSQKVRTREINITQEQFDRWVKGETIQTVAPHLSADDREFIMTGITPEEWDEAFGEEEPESIESEKRHWEQQATWNERHSDHGEDY